MVVVVISVGVLMFPFWVMSLVGLSETFDGAGVGTGEVRLPSWVVFWVGLSVVFVSGGVGAGGIIRCFSVAFVGAEV